MNTEVIPAEIASSERSLLLVDEMAKESLSTHQEVLETLPIPLFWFGPEGQLTLANRSARELFSPHELAVGSPAQGMFPGEISELFEGDAKYLPISFQGRPYKACRSDLLDKHQGWILCLFPETPKPSSESC